MNKYFKHILTSLIVMAACSSLSAQNEVMQFFIENGDTVFFATLPPAYSHNIPQKRKGKEWRDYYKTVHNFAKTYPYALIAKDIIMEAEKNLAENDLSKREREKYIKNFEKELFDRFEKPLRNLTYTQGRMLLRLIDREAGITSYYIIKNYRGGINAGFWQGVAKIFGADLKKPYDRFGEDKLLEELVYIYHIGEFETLYLSIFGKLPPNV